MDNALQREKRTKQDATESMLTSLFQMDDLLKCIIALKSNNAAGLYDMYCERINYFGPASLRWVQQMMNSKFKSHNFSYG